MYGKLLQVIALEIEKQQPQFKPVKKYTMVYQYANNQIHFIINDNPDKIPLSEPMLANGIKMYLDSNVNEPDFTIQYAIIFWAIDKPGKIGIHSIHNTTGQKQESVKAFE